MTESTRKRPLGKLALAAAGLAAALTIAACGSTGGTGDIEVPTAEGGKASGTMKMSNWTLYIDEDRETLAEFQKQTGVKVEYNEDVNGNDEFFGKVRPLLSEGDSGGRSILVVTDWMSKKMFDLGYLQKLDPNELTTVFDNLIPSLQDPAFDPGRTYSIPWQSGMTGLVIRTDLAPDVKSINDLFDPKYKGKVTMLSELRDTVPLVMKANGIDPVEASTQDWLDAIDTIKQAKESGQIRRFTGNDYVQDLVKGDTVAAIGWSGDSVQAQKDNPNLKYVQPEQGCMLWSDNMSIPIGAPNTAAAYEFMNFVYEPENQARIVKEVNYISPVKGVKEILIKEDPEIANNQLIFPSEEYLSKCTNQISPPGDDAERGEVEDAWASVVVG